MYLHLVELEVECSDWMSGCSLAVTCAPQAHKEETRGPLKAPGQKAIQAASEAEVIAVQAGNDRLAL